MLDHCKVTLGSGVDQKNYYFLSNADTYANTEVATATGVRATPANEQDEPTVKVEELQGAAILFRLTCSLENGKSREVLCSRSNLETALDGLKGKTIEGSTIQSVRVARKAVYY